MQRLDRALAEILAADPRGHATTCAQERVTLSRAENEVPTLSLRLADRLHNCSRTPNGSRRACRHRDPHPALGAVVPARFRVPDKHHCPGGPGDTIALVVFRAGTHRVGADNGTLQVRTYREGLAQKVGHDLIIDVEQWEAAAEVREDGTMLLFGSTLTHGRCGCGRVARGQAATDKDRAEIRKTIDEKILGDSRLPSARARSSQMTVD